VLSFSIGYPIALFFFYDIIQYVVASIVSPTFLEFNFLLNFDLPPPTIVHVRKDRSYSQDGWKDRPRQIVLTVFRRQKKRKRQSAARYSTYTVRPVRHDAPKTEVPISPTSSLQAS
jgi:hypothetical protein